MPQCPHCKDELKDHEAKNHGLCEQCEEDEEFYKMKQKTFKHGGVVNDFMEIYKDKVDGKIKTRWLKKGTYLTQAQYEQVKEIAKSSSFNNLIEKLKAIFPKEKK